MKVLIPLVEVMTSEDPTTRPTARDALALFDNIEKKQSIYVTKWKLKKKKSNMIMRLYRNMISLHPVATAYAKWLGGQCSLASLSSC